MHLEIIKRLLSTPTCENIFDGLLSEIEAYFDRRVTTLEEMKARESKKAKGDLWELFCRDWLISTGKYLNVWLLKDSPLIEKVTNQDNGVDLIAHTKAGYSAVQCKYRSGKTRVDWKSLSTFIALCSRTGPWVKLVVMTNCQSVTRKLPKSSKDQSICRGTFRSTSREQWLKLVGLYRERSVGEVPVPLQVVTDSLAVDLEEVRRARLARFC